MNTKLANRDTIRRDALVWVLISQVIAILPLLKYLTVWIPLVWLTVVVWRVQIFRGALPFPNFMLKTTFGLLCVMGLIATYGSSLALEAMVSFLIMGFILKLTEMRTRKDVLVVLYIGFIAIAAQFLFSQSALAACYGLLSCTLLFVALLSVYRRRRTGFREALWDGAQLIGLSMPAMIILFLLLPRLGPIWSVPNPSQQAKTGFGDTVSPGDISDLVRSGKIAFKVTFYEVADDGSIRIAAPNSKAVPSPDERYWRGMVLDHFDGRTWSKRSGNESLFEPRHPISSIPKQWQLEYIDKQAAQNSRYEYDIILEAHQRRRLFTMMAPLSVEPDNNQLVFENNYLVASLVPLVNRMQYRVISSPNYSASPENLEAAQLRRNLFLPSGVNPKARLLAGKWVLDDLTSEEKIERALERFRQSFTYTLSPPLLGKDSVDDFLFQTQEGFCEHFASSFVFLMRAADVPARVVVGYQGGEFNPNDAFLAVRQSDAHAWAEVWIKGKGWLRIDPTSAVSPDRIALGLANSISPEEVQLINNQGVLAQKFTFLADLHFTLDALSYQWHRWVLNYNPKDRESVFERLLGGLDPWRLTLTIIMVLGAVSSVLFLVVMWREYRQRAPLPIRLYERHCRKLATLGYPRKRGETASAYAERVAQSEPQLADEVKQLARLFNAIVYANQAQQIPKLRHILATIDKADPKPKKM